GTARQVFWEAQRMARIGNTIMSWEREVRAGDTASGVFAYALELGIISSSDLLDRSPEDLQETLLRSDYAGYARAEWSRHHENMRNAIARVRSVDLRGALLGHEELFRLHVGARELGI